jgi:ferric-dicitrate binding protein FerR (iron transport regulator)
MVDEEDVTAQLLRLAGAPPEPAAERSARVRQAVHDAWRAQRRRQAARRVTVVALCGLAAALILVVRVNRSRPDAGPPVATVVATTARLEGQPLILLQNAGSPKPLTASLPLHAGDAVETTGDSRASLTMVDGSSLRIDRGSRVRLVASAAVQLVDGIAYIDTSPGSRGFEVRTPLGSVRDVGTQFEVRVANGLLRIRVRTGKVRLERGSMVTSATAGTETVVSDAGLAVRQVPSYGPDWAWTTMVAPGFAIEGRSLSSFLEHTATEQGLVLRYATKDVADAAERAVLHGSVERLTPDEALAVTLSTSGLRFQRHDGELLVSRLTDSR